MSEQRVVRVLDGPVEAFGAVTRVVEMSDGGVQVQTWTGSGWAPGGDARAVLIFPSLPAERLEELGIPLGDEPAPAEERAEDDAGDTAPPPEDAVRALERRVTAALRETVQLLWARIDETAGKPPPPVLAGLADVWEEIARLRAAVEALAERALGPEDEAEGDDGPLARLLSTIEREHEPWRIDSTAQMQAELTRLRAAVAQAEEAARRSMDIARRALAQQGGPPLDDEPPR